jgi:RNA polymerase sigma-70 factor, ECF subfamily
VTDIELVDRARRGDHDAFATLVRQATPRLYGAARLILRQPDRAEDAVQDALVLAWRDIRSLREPRAWDAWLYRLTVRACYRSATRHRRHEVAELPDDLDHAAGSDFSSALDDRDRLSRQLNRLPVDQRTVVVLHFYLDLPLTDAAEILGVPVGTAKSRLHRALDAMRTSMSTRSDVVGRGAGRTS